jgi:ribosomal protein S3
VATAHTAYGTNGIKVWIFKGEVTRTRKSIASNTGAAADSDSKTQAN